MKTNTMWMTGWCVAAAVAVVIGSAMPSVKAEREDRETPSPEEVYGRIQYVEAFPDVKVKVVDSFGDLRVQIVNAFADEPGEWEIVNSAPDFKVQIVESFEDFTIEYVKAFPGVRD